MQENLLQREVIFQVCLNHVAGLDRHAGGFALQPCYWSIRHRRGGGVILAGD